MTKGQLKAKSTNHRRKRDPVFEIPSSFRLDPEKRRENIKKQAHRVKNLSEISISYYYF